MQTDINRPYLLFATIYYSLSEHADVNSKITIYVCVWIQIAALRYADAVNNRIRIPFMCNIFLLYIYIYIIFDKFTKTMLF
jgi:hypothetical protein